MTPLPRERLLELLRIEADATPAPWRSIRSADMTTVYVCHGEDCVTVELDSDEDSHLIVASRNALRPLVTELLEARSEIERLRKEIEGAIGVAKAHDDHGMEYVLRCALAAKGGGR